MVPRASCSAWSRRPPRPSRTRRPGSSGWGERSAARTTADRWSCAAGAAVMRRATPTAWAWARRARPCPISRRPAASCSGATTRASRDCRTRPRQRRRSAAALASSSSIRAAPGSPPRPTSGCACGPAAPALFGEYTIGAREAGVACRTAFDLAAEVCRRYSPDAVQEICGVPADDVEHAARMLWESRPVAYYAWSGVEQQSNATQVARAISLLYALTGSFDVEGGNVQFPAVPSPNVAGEELISPQHRTRALGLPDRPLGPGP